MTQYFRPLGIMSGRSAREALAQGRALPLAGGPLAFSLVEIIERAEPGRITRRIEDAPEWRQQLSVHCASRVRLRGFPDAELVMGIVNATPDSFSDGGRFFDPDHAIAEARRQIADGAAIVDIGGESTRPGAVPVPPAEEIRRIVPVIEVLQPTGVVISVDTRNADTMRAALVAGATIVNDVSALTYDPAAVDIAREASVDVVLMHMRGHDPRTMQIDPSYDDVALDVYDYLASRIAACGAAGIARSQIVADPGIGFGKTAAHNLELLDQLSMFHGLGVPLMVGVSRKGFIGQISPDAPPQSRLGGSLALGLAAISQGARILRVHDVAETVQAVRVATAQWR